MTANLPAMTLVQRATGPRPALVDARGSTTAALVACGSPIARGDRVGIAVGSRGIDRLPDVVRGVVDWVVAVGGRPFVFPAMGSHGGATAEGQRAVLAGYDVTAESIGAPVTSDVSARPIGVTSEGIEVFASDEASAANAVIVVNRIKPHTDFGGDLGSGLTKMLVVGLGKPAGAAAFHRAAATWGHARALRSCARVVLERVPVRIGVALIEGLDHTLEGIHAIPADEIERLEPALLARARALMPRLPWRDIDLLIVDEMGKDKSGCGMDPNVVGRSIFGYSLTADGMKDDVARVQRLFVRDLTGASHGNAMGVGLADFATTRLVRAMDREATYANAFASLSIQGVKLPLTFDRDVDAIRFALGTLGKPVGDAFVVRIRDTLSLDRFEASAAMLTQPPAFPLTAMASARAMTFTSDGMLTALES